MALSLLPMALLLWRASLPWPANWDDFQRGFNGLTTSPHDWLIYGVKTSRTMLKLLVHDPLLTFSNRMDVLRPRLSGALDVLLLTLPALATSLRAVRRGRPLQGSAVVLGFSGLTLIQAKFLPPSAYPLAFSLAFTISWAAALHFDGPGRQARQRAPTGRIVLVWLLEQLAFLFYACCFVQNLLFCLLNRTAPRARNAILPDAVLIRFLPFPLLNLLWRLNNTPLDVEAVGSIADPAQALTAFGKWALGGTTLAPLVGAGPTGLGAIGEHTLLHPLSGLTATATALLCIGLCVLGCHWCRGRQGLRQEEAAGMDSFGDPLPVAVRLALSVVVGWSLPVLSARYLEEMQQWNSQIYVAMRFTGIGVAVLVAAGAVLVGRILARGLAGIGIPASPALLTHACLLPLLIWSFTINPLMLQLQQQEQAARISLRRVCDGQPIRRDALEELIPHHVLQGKTRAWIPSLPRYGTTHEGHVPEKLQRIEESLNAALRNRC